MAGKKPSKKQKNRTQGIPLLCEGKSSQNPEQSELPQDEQVNVGGRSAQFDQVGQQVGTQVSVGGDVQGDVAIGDIVHGEKFGGDKVEGDKVFIQQITRDDARNQRNHTILRQVVRRFWIDGVLKSSLYNEMLIRLSLESNPDAVDNRPWDLILKQPNQPDHTIADDKGIIDIFDIFRQYPIWLKLHTRLGFRISTYPIKNNLNTTYGRYQWPG